MAVPTLLRFFPARARLATGALLATTTMAAACSDAGDAAAPATEGVDAGPTEETDAATEAPDAGEACAPPKKSACGKAGSWVRGIAHFDPARFAGKKPVLRVVLRHSFTLFRGEETIGGRLHWYESVKIDDPSKGEVPFALDMCASTKMWSEENGTFHLVLIMDENDNNDLDDATTNENAIVVGTPDKGELTKMVDVELSCNAPSPCLDVTLDCTDGTACTTFTPMTKCAKKTPSCKSDSSFCK